MSDNRNVTIEPAPGLARRLVPLLIVLVAGVAVVAAARWMQSLSREAPPTEPPAVNVQVATVRGEDVVDEFELPGVVMPNRVVQISAEVAGRVERMCCEKGALVKQGQPLVHINTDLLKADHDRAMAEMKFAQSQYDRTLDLRKSNSATQKELEDVQSRLDMARAALNAAKARLDRAVIYAPIEGVMDQRPVEEGTLVAPGSPVCTIVDMATAKVTVDVPEMDVRFLKLGAEEKIVLMSGRLETGSEPVEVTGKIGYISEQASNTNHTTQAEVFVDNANHVLRSGQIVTVRLLRRVIRDAIMVPLAAVVPLEDQRVVYVADGSIAQQRRVELGIIKGTRVQVVNPSASASRPAAGNSASGPGSRPGALWAGLRAGDQLILPPANRFVGPGQKIAVLGAAKDALSVIATDVEGGL